MLRFAVMIALPGTAAHKARAVSIIAAMAPP